MSDEETKTAHVYGGNGSRCATCDIPDRTGKLETHRLMTDRDAMSTLAALRAVDTRNQARFSSLDSAVAEVHRICNELVSLIRLGAGQV